MFWAGQNIQNLKEPISNFFRKGELQEIRSVNDDVESKIKEYFETKT
jgi:DNA polymerase/3'-5' exonuclease PolX